MNEVYTRKSEVSYPEVSYPQISREYEILLQLVTNSYPNL